jgi:pimeloyl-ACP methyl ester carboxylesterase
MSLALSSAIATASAETTPPPAAPAPAVYVKPPPPGELVDIGGRRLHVHCKGDARGPAVVFEAGLSQYTAESTYSKAQDLIAPFARTCTYDRAGLGWSDPVDGPRTQQDMVEDLHKLLAAMRLTGPVVIVGHSMGGLLARLYAKTYPEQVAALVLVDASNEAINFAPGAAAARNAMVAKIDEGLKSAKEGTPVLPFPAGTSADVMMAFTPAIFRAVKQETQAIDLMPDAMKHPNGYGTLGDKPLAILRRGKAASPPSAEDTNWREAQESMSALSTRSFLVVATDAGHVIPYEAPQVVADAVRRVLVEVGNP